MVFCSSFSMNSAQGTDMQHIAVFPRHIIFFTPRGSKVSEMALVKCWNSIKINTNKMFTSTIEGLFVFFSLVG